VGEGLGEVPGQVPALVEVAEAVPVIVEILLVLPGDQVGGGLLVETAEHIEGAAGGDIVAQGLAGDIASGIPAGEGGVSGSGLAAGVDGVHQLFQMAVGVVAVLDAVVGVAGAVAGGIEALEGAAELVVGDLLVVVAVTAADTQAGDGLAGTTELIVFHQFDIAADGVLDTGELAEAIGGTVVGPGGVAVAGAPRQAVDAGDQAAEAVMGQGAGLALGVGLQGEFAKAVVLVAPGALVGVVHGGLAAQQVVTQAGEVAGVVHRAGEVAL